MHLALVYLWAHAQSASAATRVVPIPPREELLRLTRRSRAAWRLYDQTREALGVPRRARFTGDPIMWAA